MEQLIVTIKDILQRAVEFIGDIVSNFLTFQDLKGLLNSPWIIIVPVFVIAISRLIYKFK